MTFPKNSNFPILVCMNLFLVLIPYTSSDPKKSRISLWKLITLYPNKQIWPNKLIKLKLSNHDNDCNWWYSFREINVLKSVNKLRFEQNNKKWANLVYFYFFKGLQNLGKYFKPNFPIKVWRSIAFSQKLFILNAKNSNSTFFWVGGSIYFLNLRREIMLFLLYVAIQQVGIQNFKSIESSFVILSICLAHKYFLGIRSCDDDTPTPFSLCIYHHNQRFSTDRSRKISIGSWTEFFSTLNG